MDDEGKRMLIAIGGLVAIMGALWVLNTVMEWHWHQIGL